MFLSRSLPILLRRHRALLEREKADLLQEMMSLPQNAVVRRINELVKRARAVKVHAYIVHYLKKQMPYVLGTVFAFVFARVSEVPLALFLFVQGRSCIHASVQL
jgi:hypothetical protein